MSRDLREYDELFTRWCRLTYVCESLEGLVKGYNIHEEHKQGLRWAASYIAGADRDSPYHQESGLDCVEQTIAAPDFLRILIDLGYEKRPEFLDSFYLYLKSGGEADISDDDFFKGKELIEKMNADVSVKVRNSRY